VRLLLVIEILNCFEGRPRPGRRPRSQSVPWSCDPRPPPRTTTRRAILGLPSQTSTLRSSDTLEDNCRGWRAQRWTRPCRAPLSRPEERPHADPRTAGHLHGVAILGRLRGRPPRAIVAAPPPYTLPLRSSAAPGKRLPGDSRVQTRDGKRFRASTLWRRPPLQSTTGTRPRFWVLRSSVAVKTTATARSGDDPLSTRGPP
jgi:hypothetical protein